MQINPEKTAVPFCPRRKLCQLQRTRKTYNEKYIFCFIKWFICNTLIYTLLGSSMIPLPDSEKHIKGFLKTPNYSSSLLIFVPFLNEWICRKRKYGATLVLVFLLLILRIFFCLTSFKPHSYQHFLKTGWTYKVFSLLLTMKKKQELENILLPIEMDELKIICIHFNQKNSLCLITCRKHHNQVDLTDTFKMYTLNQDTLPKVALNQI